MTQTEKVILHTLAYSSLFHFPLTKEELWRFLLSDQAGIRAEFDAALKKLGGKITSKNGLYALSENAQDIAERRMQTAELTKKLRIAKRAAYYLSYIPTISLIAISGSVAMGKARQEDDIDFFIITKKNTLFMTRIWIQAVLELLNLRRKPLTADAPDKVCVNLMIDESRLLWPKEARDVYTAHEIVQLQPLFERNSLFEQFIKQNGWVLQFFPHAFEKRQQFVGSGWKRNYVGIRAIGSIVMLRPFEKLVSRLQRAYMKRHQTTEIITDTFVAFHPIDYRTKTLDGLNDKLRQLGLLTNK